MSLILDALKKAEQDRNAGQAPALDELLARPPTMAALQRRGRRQQQQDTLMALAMAAALIFAVIGIAYWLWPRADQTAPPTAALAPATSPASQLAQADAAPALAELPNEAVDLTETGATEAFTMDDLDGEAPAVRHSPAPQPTAEPTSPEPSPFIAPSEPEPAPEPVTIAAPPPVVAVRPLKEMPPAFRNEFPRITLDVHVYDANPLRRFALLNGRKYRETDTLIEGPRVIEITPQGVVVEYRNSKVLLELPH